MQGAVPTSWLLAEKRPSEAAPPPFSLTAFRLSKRSLPFSSTIVFSFSSSDSRDDCEKVAYNCKVGGNEQCSEVKHTSNSIAIRSLLNWLAILTCICLAPRQAERGLFLFYIRQHRLIHSEEKQQTRTPGMPIQSLATAVSRHVLVVYLSMQDPVSALIPPHLITYLTRLYTFHPIHL
jgi:hypothetical protein